MEQFNTILWTKQIYFADISSKSIIIKTVWGYGTFYFNMNVTRKIFCSSDWWTTIGIIKKQGCCDYKNDNKIYL